MPLPQKPRSLYNFAMQITDITDTLGFTNTKEKAPIPPKGAKLVSERVEVERPAYKELYKWTVPLKVGSSLNPKKVRTFLIIGSVIAIILALMQEFALIIAVVSIAFLAYIMSQTPSSTVTHKLTTHGLNFAGQAYNWEEFRHFYWATEDMDKHKAMVFDTFEPLPGRLFVLVEPKDEKAIQEIVENYVTFLQEEPKTFIDKAFENVSSKFDFS